MENSIEISPSIKSAISPTDLLKPKGKFGMTPTTKMNFFDNSGILFTVQSENFNFQLSIDSQALVARRNGFVCSLTPEMFPNKVLLFFLFTWSPTQLTMLSGYRD